MFCHVCQADGHSACSRSCPTYRKILTEKREDLKKKAAEAKVQADRGAEAARRRQARKEAKKAVNDEEGWTTKGAGRQAQTPAAPTEDYEPPTINADN